MKPSTLVLAAVLLAFAVLSLWTMTQVGYLGIFAAGLDNPGALQILVDLIIACTLAIAWIVADARARGRNPWPWVVVTLAAGSFGPLGYLLWRDLAGRPALAP